MAVFSQRLFLVAALLAASCGGGAPAVEDLPALPEIADVFPPDDQAEVERLRAAIESDPLNAEAAGELAMLAHAYDQLDAAQKLYARSAAIDRASFRWLYYRGSVLAQQGRQEEAAEVLAQALDRDDEYVPLLLRLAELRLALDQVQEAEVLYAEVAERDPSNAEALYGLGRTLAMRDDTAGAVEKLGQATRLVPGYGQAHYELSLAYRDLGDRERAERHLAMYQQNPRGAPVSDDPLTAAVRGKRRSVTDLLSQASGREQSGDLAGAIDLHLRALEMDPTVPQTHVNLVSLYGRTGEIAKAEEHYREALELDAAQADLHYNYGVLLFQARRFPEAKEAFEKALQANPDYAAAHNNLGQMLEGEGNIDGAIREYEAALAARPGYQLALFHLGRMKLAKRRPAEAARHFEAALEPRDENAPQILYGIMAAKALAGDRAEAVRRGEQARALAAEMGQTDLVAQIDKDLAKLR